MASAHLLEAHRNTSSGLWVLVYLREFRRFGNDFNTWSGYIINIILEDHSKGGFDTATTPLRVHYWRKTSP